MTEGKDVAVIENRELTIADLKSNIQRIHAAMKEVMVKDVHYGTIPGTDKPSLWKPGAEIIATMFRFGVYPIVIDLSGPDSIRYRVTCAVTHMPTGVSVGHGIGEASTDEEKYRWRKAVCDAEWEAEDPARRREAWKHGKGGGNYKVRQVRTAPPDAANTILKMAKKRAFVDAILTCTAASDLFGQDAEDLSPEMRAEIYGEEAVQQAAPQAPQPKAAKEAPEEQTAAQPASGDLVEQAGSAVGGPFITPNMGKTILGRMRAKGVDEKVFCAHFKISVVGDLPRSKINEALDHIDAL